MFPEDFGDCPKDYPDDEFDFNDEFNEYVDDYNEDNPDDDDDYLIDGVGFEDPGGNSALRRATRTNPRDQPCPTCGQCSLTRLDVAAGYQCDRCADAAEGRGGY